MSEELSEAELQDLQEQWEAIKGVIDDAWQTIADGLSLICETIQRVVSHFAGMIQRAYLCQLLPRWIPEAARAWLARHWPRKLLPKLSDAIEWLRAEAARQGENNA